MSDVKYNAQTLAIAIRRHVPSEDNVQVHQLLQLTANYLEQLAAEVDRLSLVIDLFGNDDPL